MFSLVFSLNWFSCRKDSIQDALSVNATRGRFFLGCESGYDRFNLLGSLDCNHRSQNIFRLSECDGIAHIGIEVLYSGPLDP